MAGNIAAFFRNDKNLGIIDRLMDILDIEKPKTDENSMTLTGLNFVVTGSLNHYENRNVLKEVIESKGGKVTGSVTSKTTCLINNDNTSNSTKNKTAKELNIPILTEDEFIKTYLS